MITAATLTSLLRHSSMAGMSCCIVDEELNAMLQSEEHSPAQSTLASVMALMTTAPAGMMELSSGAAEHIHTNSANFSSHCVSSSLHQGVGFSSSSGPGRQPPAASARGVNNASAMETSSNVLLQATTGVPNRSMPLQQQQPSLWPFSNNDEQTKSDLEVKIRVTKIAAGANARGNNNSRFRPATLDAAAAVTSSGGLSSPSFSGGCLQRYHSAPSSLLQNLADEIAFSTQQVSSPAVLLLPGNKNNSDHGSNRNHDGHNHESSSLMSHSFFSGNNNLTPISEGVPQPMETDKLLGGASTSSSHQYSQFLSPPMMEPKKQSSLVTTTSMLGVKQESMPAKRLGKKPRPPKVNLFRQSSLPADWLADLKDSIDETGPSPQIPGMTSPDESLSGGTSEETGADRASGKASMYSRDDSFFLNDTSSGGLWNSLPNSVGLIAGKRISGVLSDTMIDTGVSGEGSLRGLGEPGTLIRHSSLPATMNRPTSPGFDDLADISVPCRARAKRGCATHPRSIAERIRRTKITERMKRLQDLVPNMDKQTNTSDMLDEAVEYVKQLKQKVQDLSDTVVQLREMQEMREVKGLRAEEVQVLLKMQLSSAEVCHHQTGARWLAAQRPIDVLKKPNAGEITPLILVLVLSTVNSILNGSGNHVGFLGGE
ncbi:unnamed protein product [Sphagnum jensenii]|uniref:BHLH domain-containing protein n=1 Tax=Sphagnum jensenii TaxID=128206 RepID=A0ABP0VUY9_9BRYO